MKRTPLRHCSKKRAKALRTYSQLRKDFLKKHTGCEAGRKLVAAGQPHLLCSYLATEIHHRNKRNGDRLNDTSEWVAVCAYCHRNIHANRSVARQLGLLK